MRRLVGWIEGFALAFGGPGLFLLAFLDSSFLSFPEVVDLLMMGLVIRHKERMLYYALMPTLGSVAGCFVLYLVSRKGGEAFLRKRFSGPHLDRVLGVFQKYGLLAVAVPSILPPPVPFKIFVFAAGVAGVKPVEFLVAISIGRGIRYFGEALLALLYGEAAIAYLQAHAKGVALGVSAAMLLGGLVWIWLHNRKPAR